MSRFSLNYVLILIFNKTTLEEKNDSNEDFIIITNVAWPSFTIMSELS